jgi:hypothetical protein
VIGHIIREIQRSDTLYHPDAYAWFAGLSFHMPSDKNFSTKHPNSSEIQGISKRKNHDPKD